MTSQLDEHYIRTNVEWIQLPSDVKQVIIIIIDILCHHILPFDRNLDGIQKKNMINQY